MRAALLGLAFVLGAAGCGDDDSGGRATPADAAIDAVPACFPSGGACTEGHACGTGCCNPGERCVNDACSCGGGAACLPGDYCATGGPVLPDVEGCGVLCCGPASGQGCPI